MKIIESLFSCSEGKRIVMPGGWEARMLGGWDAV
jgi:hypothetical protein